MRNEDGVTLGPLKVVPPPAEKSWDRPCHKVQTAGLQKHKVQACLHLAAFSIVFFDTQRHRYYIYYLYYRCRCQSCFISDIYTTCR